MHVATLDLFADVARFTEDRTMHEATLALRG